MPDITMCKGDGCTGKEKCYRFTANPSKFRQSYFLQPPIKNGNCTMYWGENAENIFNQLKQITK